MPLFHERGQVRQQRVELGALLVGTGLVDEPRVAGGLAQPEQRLEHLHFGLLHPLGVHLAQQALPVVIAQLAVLRPLPGAQGAVQGVLGPRRQFRGHLGLGPPQHKGPDGLRKQHPARGAVVPGLLLDVTEGTHFAEHSRVQKLEEAPELADVVLDRRPAQGQAVAPVEQP